MVSVKISIFTATWNCAATAGNCLESVAGENWSNREHVVIDGPSRDAMVPNSPCTIQPVHESPSVTLQ